MIALSPDGKTLAVASSTGIYVYDAETLEEKRVLNTRGFVVFTPTGHLIVGYHIFEVWDTNTGQQLRAFGAPIQKIDRVALSPTGEFLAIIENQNQAQQLRIWNVNTEREILTLDLDYYGAAIAFTPDGRTLALHNASSIRLLNLLTLEFYQDIHPVAPIFTMFFNPEGRTLIFDDGGDGGQVKALDLQTNQERFLLGQEVRGKNMTLSPDGLNLALINFDGSIQIWNLATGENWQTFGGDPTLDRITFSPDGKKVLLHGLETIEIWEVETGKILGQLFYPVAIGQVSFHQAGGQYWVAADGYSIFQTQLHMWDITTQQLVSLPTRLSNGVLSPDRRWFARPGDCGTSVEIWEPVSGQLAHELKVSCSGTPLAFSPDGLTLAVGEQESIQLWDVATGHLSWTLTNPGNYRVAFSPDSQTIAVGSAGKGIRLWDTTTGQRIWVLPIVRGEEETPAGNDNRFLIFSPDGSKLASMEYSAIRVWDLATNPRLYQRLYSLKINYPPEEGSSRIEGVVFSPDGRLLVTNGGDNTHFVIRDANTGQELQLVEYPNSAIYTVAFSPDGRWLALMGGGIIRLWGVE